MLGEGTTVDAMARPRKAKIGRPYSMFGQKDPMPVSALLTPLARRILVAAQLRTGATRSNVLELLTRLHAAALTRDDFAPVLDETLKQ